MFQRLHQDSTQEPDCSSGEALVEFEGYEALDIVRHEPRQSLAPKRRFDVVLDEG
jgi:hypothetical protein